MRVVAGVLLLLALTGSRALAQAVFLDKPVQAGELILFPDINNPRAFYYLPNKIVLGKNKDATPQFSFLRWVENEKSTGEETRSEGEGGGIVHTVVQLEVTPEQIAEAERELQRKVKSAGSGDEATIVGPIIYKKGTMALIFFWSASVVARCASRRPRNSGTIGNVRPSRFFVVPTSSVTTPARTSTCRHWSGRISLLSRQPVR